MKNVVGRHHQYPRLELRLDRERDVYRHLVAVEIGIECSANERMQLDGLTFDQFWFKSLDAETVERRRPVQHHRMLTNHFIEDIPDFGLFLFDKFLRLFDGRRQPFCIKPSIDEGLEELERHLLWQTTLMEFEIWPNHNHRTAGIVDALAKQILPEAALLSLKHVGKRLERPLVGSGNDPPPP